MVDDGYIRTPETRARISSALRGKPKSEEHKAAMRGKKHAPFARTEEHRRKIAAALSGKPKSAEHKRKVSESKTGVPTWSDERKQRMSGEMSGSGNPMFGKTVSPEILERKRIESIGKTSLLEKYGVSRQEYAKEIAAGNKWCVFRKHFAPAVGFRNKLVACDGCRSEYLRQGSLRKVFGVDQEWYLAKLAGQGGGCAICGSTTLSAGKKHLSIDHNHATGQVRGVLCARCNIAMERLEAVPNWAALATAYLVHYAMSPITP